MEVPLLSKGHPTCYDKIHHPSISIVFQGAKPEAGRFLNFDHVEWWVGNAKMAAAHFCARFGFDYFAYKGLETGERKVAAHAVRQGDCIFVFKSRYGITF